jgi:hypothetical protein
MKFSSRCKIAVNENGVAEELIAIRYAGVLQVCFKRVTRVLQGCYKSVTRVLLECKIAANEKVWLRNYLLSCNALVTPL